MDLRFELSFQKSSKQLCCSSTGSDTAPPATETLLCSGNGAQWDQDVMPKLPIASGLSPGWGIFPLCKASLRYPELYQSWGHFPGIPLELRERETNLSLWLS